MTGPPIVVNTFILVLHCCSYLRRRRAGPFRCHARLPTAVAASLGVQGFESKAHPTMQAAAMQHATAGQVTVSAGNQPNLKRSRCECHARRTSSQKLSRSEAFSCLCNLDHLSIYGLTQMSPVAAQHASALPVLLLQEKRHCTSTAAVSV